MRHARLLMIVGALDGRAAGLAALSGLAVAACFYALTPRPLDGHRAALVIA